MGVRPTAAAAVVPPLRGAAGTPPPIAAEAREIAERARADGRLALDTEFVSEGRYRPLLCLVQVAVAPRGAGGKADVAVFDPIEGFDPGPLAEVVSDPAIEVVVHAGGQDVAILRRQWGIRPTNLFDTQI